VLECLDCYFGLSVYSSTRVRLMVKHHSDHSTTPRYHSKERLGHGLRILLSLMPGRDAPRHLLHPI